MTDRMPQQTTGLGQPPARLSLPSTRTASTLLLASSLLLFALHYFHLAADFPHHTWPDWARYTDEGWYAGAAPRQIFTGNWYLAGDFNPAVALPVFPALAFLLFRLTGVSIIALRAANVTLLGASLLVIWLLLRRRSGRVAASAGVFLCASSLFLYAYSRLGIVEPLLIFESLLSLLVLSFIRPGDPIRKVLTLCAVAGILLAAMVLTKTPGLFLFPAAFYLLLQRCGFSLRRSCLPALVMAAVAAVLLLAWLGMIRHLGLGEDFHHLFSINGGGANRRTILPKLWLVLSDAVSLGPALLGCAAVAIPAALLARRRNLPPLLMPCILGVLGYAIFITYRGWIEPRYYLIPMPLLAIATVLSIQTLAASRLLLLRASAWALGAILLLSCIVQSATMLRWTLHPSYSYVDAARSLYTLIDRDSCSNRVVLGSVSQETALLTGQPGVQLTDVDGLMPLRDEILRYQPGWYIGFDEVPLDTRNTLSGIDTIDLVASIPAYGDDWGHHRLNLYRLLPACDQREHAKQSQDTR